MDAEPPRIVFEDPAVCTDADRSSDILRQSVATGMAGLPSWSVEFRVERSASGGLQARGDITDSQGMLVARRVLVASGHQCAALALGVGLWASLVHEAESRRLRGGADAGASPRPPAAEADGTSAGRGVVNSDGTSAKGGMVNSDGTSAEGGVVKPGDVQSEQDALGAGAPPLDVSTVPAPSERRSRTPEWFLHHDDGEKTLEIGVSGFLMSGAHGGAVTGASPYVVAEAAHGIFLRPSLAFGRTIGTPAVGDSRGTWLDSRLDTCLRVPGLYSTGAGLQLDLCAGGDLGVTVDDTSRSFPFAALGPSLDMRGELGTSLAVTLRGVFGVNLLSSPDLWSGRIELAVSWGLR